MKTKPRLAFNLRLRLWECLGDGYYIVGPTAELAYQTWVWAKIIPPAVADWMREWERRRCDSGATQL